MNNDAQKEISLLKKEILSRQASKALLGCIIENDRARWNVWCKNFFECQKKNFPDIIKSEEDLHQIELRLYDSDINDLDLTGWKGFFTLRVVKENVLKQREDLDKIDSVLHRRGLFQSFNQLYYEKLLKDTFDKIQNSFYSGNKEEWDKLLKVFFKLLNEKFPETFVTESDLKLIKLDLDSNKWKNSGQNAIFKNWKFPFELRFQISGVVDFSDSEFYGETRFNLNGAHEVKFINTKFYERVVFDSPLRDHWIFKAEFIGSYFVNRISFVGINFAPNSSFIRCQFYGLQKVPSEIYLEESKDYSKYNMWYQDDVCFLKSSFKGTVDFSWSSFFTNVDFRLVEFSESLNFENAFFYDSELRFTGATFNGRTDFKNDKFYGNSLLILDGAVFKGHSAHFTQDLEVYDINYQGLQKIHVNHTIFECPAIFDLKFQSCPDFSKAHFLKHYSIAETWLKEGDKIPDPQITKDDVEKLRFFKNYFEKNGNHFKEREYFAYEMNAVEKRKRVSKDKDLWLFKLYKIFGNFGISIRRPFFWLLGSWVLFYLTFFFFFPQEFAKKSEKTSFQIINKTEVVMLSEAKHLVSLSSEQIARDPSAEPQDDRELSNGDKNLGASNQNKEACTKIIPTIATKTLLLTFNPFASFKFLENGSFGFVFVGVVQAFINTALLFLLGLGIRNRFKLK